MLAKGDLPLSILKQAADEGNRLARQLADEKAHRENYLRDLVREALVTGLRRLDKVTEYVVEEAYLMRVPTREEVAEAILSLLKEIGQ